MDFQKVLPILIQSFQTHNVRYALIGGFALGAWGVVRATVDIDFLVMRDDLPTIDKTMKENGYKCVYQSENVSQYVSNNKVFGEVDYLHAFRPISRGMLERSIEKEVFGKALRIRVLKPEDIIGLKIQAVANNPDRTALEYLDIEALMARYGASLDWPLLSEYFLMFNFDEKFGELKQKYAQIKF